MGIQISSAETKPAITYNKVHMTKLEVMQPTQTDDLATPKYQVIISYRHYGIVDNVRYYKDEDVHRVAIDDFIALATADAMQGNMILANSLSSIEAAVAAIISDQTGVQATVV